MKKKIFRNFFLLSAVCIIITTIMISFIMYNGFYKDMQSEVRKEATYIAEAVNLSGEDYFVAVEKTTEDRVTLIQKDGTVLYDNRQKAQLMENHSDRPEVSDALKNGTGEAVRVSGTLGMQTFYAAVKLENGDVIRLANTTDSAYAAVADNIPYMVLICAVMLGISLLMAKGQTRHIVSPINELDLENPLNNDVYGEFSPLLRKMEQQKKVIDQTFSTLQKEREEFESITQNMSEGLIVLNSQGEMLIVNRRAAEIFGKNEEGKHYLTLNRSAEFREIAEKALRGEASECKLKHNGRLYGLVAMPTAAEQDEESRGAVVLALDITEKAETEQLRREFSANVSHELKTPLTSIHGYAEIIKEGIAKPEDVNGFAAKICDESRRMIALVEDIMQISKLDEATSDFAESEIELHSLCDDVAQRLAKKAEEAQVSVSVEGDKTVKINGAAPLIAELVFNLCDNAIKYNKEGGSVILSVKNNPPTLVVSDTGIGIAKDEQSRVFERFYRVDKSHSKETGGTGLGLSIVKHIVKKHNAKLKLDSKPSVGTTIEIEF